MYLFVITGSVMKSMDRGVEAANSLVSYLFLFLLPAVMECLAVVILFFLQFKQYTLGIVVFVGVGLYSVCTIYITQWRKKFRVQTNKHDNEFHEKATDSILNYETVKYFTNEKFEIERFTSSVEKYQVQVSATTLSLSLLNVTQQVMFRDHYYLHMYKRCLDALMCTQYLLLTVARFFAVYFESHDDCLHAYFRNSCRKR